MEMEHVEALTVEHLAYVAGIARRERERAHRAVGRHAEAVAEADDVALALLLRPVDAADDAHVVAARDEPVVEVAHMGVDAARQWVNVGRDQADLHRPPHRVTQIAPRAGSQEAMASRVTHRARILLLLGSEYRQLVAPRMRRSLPAGLRRSRSPAAGRRPSVRQMWSVPGRRRRRDGHRWRQRAVTPSSSTKSGTRLRPGHARRRRIEHLDRIGVIDVDPPRPAGALSIGRWRTADRAPGGGR